MFSKQTFENCNFLFTMVNANDSCKKNLTNALFLSTNGIYTATKVNDFILRIIVLSDRALGYGGIWQSLLSHLCYSTSANYRTELMSKPVIVVALYTIFDLTLIQLAGIGFSGSIPSRRILPHPRKLSCIDGSKKDNIMNIDVASRHVISVHDLAFTYYSCYPTPDSREEVRFVEYLFKGLKSSVIFGFQ